VTVPWSEIDTVFLDAGNTLVSIDFPWVASVLFERGLEVEPIPVLRRRGRANRLWRQVLPGVPEGLRAFRELGLRLVVVSNSDGSAERGLEEAGLRAFFDDVLDSAVVGYEKPDPRIFEHALERSGAEPERAVHVGDLFHADVTGARAAGIHAVLLDPYGDWEGVDCERARDLPDLAERLAASRR
jgi:putative hydrolase of the HAD superfamily